jgi:hypothetical protein
VLAKVEEDMIIEEGSGRIIALCSEDL